MNTGPLFACTLWQYTQTHTQHLRTAVTLTALLKVHLTPRSVICLSQKYTPVSRSLTRQRRNFPFCSQEALLCSDTALIPCKKNTLVWVLLTLWNGLSCSVCVLHLVPDDICVVTTIETWAEDFPACTHEQVFTALLRLETSQAVFLHHLQMEGPIAATGQQRNEHWIEAQSHAAYTNQKNFIICYTKKKIHYIE